MKSPFFLCLLLSGMLLEACSNGTRESKLEQYQAEMHQKDSVGLTDQERTLAYYQSQWEALMPVVDSLLPLFKYEPKDPKYQDHGYYVLARNSTRVLVRDDGQDLLMYRDGKRVDVNQYQFKTSDAEYPLYERAKHLQIVMSDISELEKRIRQTSLEIQKYENKKFA